MSATQRLLRSAHLRLRLADFGTRCRWMVLLVGAGALVAILASRLLGILPGEWITPLTLGALLVLALGLAAALHRRIPLAEAARQVDARAGSKELFLTASLITNSPGAYSGIVLEQAEAQAGKVSADRLIPFHWWPGLRDALITVAIVTAAYLWLPQLDPFRMDATRQETARQQARLEETKKITAIRKEELTAKSAAVSEQVEMALKKLDQTLKQAKPEERQANASKLNEQSQDFSDLWKKLAEQMPRNAAEQMERAAQSFGDPKQQQAMREAIEALKKGDPKALQEQLKKLQEELAKIAQQPAGAEQKKQLEQLAREIAKNAEQLRQQLGEKGLNDALQRALEQMDMAQLQELAKDAMNAANESLQLSQQELERMGEMFKDMQNVQDALKNLQAAKQLNEKGGLDGKDAEGAGAKTPEDYQKLYEKLLAERGGQGQGQGDGNMPGEGGGQGKSGNAPGIGQGGSVGEDPTAKTATKEEKAKTQLGAGKLLMQWKEEGVGDIGKRNAEYEAAVRAVKEGVAEAIRNEQVPPGYHSTIQKYFDRLPSDAPKK